MAKLNDKAIQQSDLIEFLDGQSDFAFELLVLNKLRAKQFGCRHGGTYEDPVTKKLRQFDLRAIRKFGYAQVHLALECKQVRPNFPLLVLRVPRRLDESFHEVLLVVDPSKQPLCKPVNPVPDYVRKAMTIRVSANDSLYRPEDLVGKSCAQVGRDSLGITGTDSEMFGKWSQGISSAQGMIDEACDNPPSDSEGWIFSLILPIVVVPDERLWVADYDSAGVRASEPRQVDRCPYLICTSCYTGSPLYGTSYVLSHLEFTTVSGLDHLIDDLGTSEGPNGRYFPEREAHVRFASAHHS